MSILIVPITGKAYSSADVIAWWSCDEASGVRADSGDNSLDLTDNNTVTTQTAVVGDNACSFTSANSEYLTVADSAVFPTGDATWSFWAEHNSNWTGSVDLWNKGDGTAMSWRILFDSNILYFTAYSPGGTGYQVSWSLTGSTTADVFAHYVITYDSSAATAELYVNGNWNVSKNVTTTSLRDTSGSNYIGRWSGSSVNYHNGGLDEVVLLNLYADQTLVDTLYNSGSGISYADFIGSTTSTTTATTTTTSLDVSELIWVMELYLSMMLFLVFTYIGYKFTKFFI